MIKTTRFSSVCGNAADHGDGFLLRPPLHNLILILWSGNICSRETAFCCSGRRAARHIDLDIVA